MFAHTFEFEITSKTAYPTGFNSSNSRINSSHLVLPLYGLVCSIGLMDSSSPRPEQSSQLTRATLIYVLCAAINSCNLGYDIGVSTDAGRLIQQDMELTDVQREFFVGSINFWASA